MNYKVLLPVMNRPELVQHVLDQIPDFERLILVNNYTDPVVMKQSVYALDRGATVYHFPLCLGCGGSWNLGMMELERDADVVIILASSAVFERPFQLILDKLDEYQLKHYRYIFDATTSLHCWAMTREGLRVGGYFDENFWPCYYEDTDYCQRSKRNGFDGGKVYVGQTGLMRTAGRSLTVRSDPALMMLHQNTIGPIVDYYERKWGKLGAETYATPFDDPSMGVNDWSVKDSRFNNTLINNPDWQLYQRRDYERHRLLPQ